MPADRERQRSRSRLPSSPIPVGRDPSATPILSPNGQAGLGNDESSPGLMSCERCRKRKKKCDKKRPICDGCVKSQEECIYLVRGQGTPTESALRRKTEVAELRARCLELEAKIVRLTRERDLRHAGPLQPPSHPHFTAISPYSAPPSPLSRIYCGASIPTSTIASRSRLSLVERAVLRILTKEHDAGSSVRGTIGRQLGTTFDDPSHLDGESSSTPLFPHRNVVKMLVDRYFDFSYGVVPFVAREVIEQDLASVYGDGALVPNLGDFAAPDIHIFRLAALFIITSGRLDDQERQLFRPNTAALHALVIKHLPAAFQADDMACLICVSLLAVVAILVFVTSSPYEVTGIAVAMMMEMNLHENAPERSIEEQEERRRVFWSIFLVDRVVSTHMTRPVAIPEEIISVRLPQSDMGGMTTQADDMSPADFFRHLVLMRRLNGIMLEKITLAAQIINPDDLFTDLRNQIDDWWNNVTSSFSTIPNSSSFHTSRHPFFELNYNLFLTNLYRPSRLFAQTTPMRIPILRAASSRAIELYWELYDRRRVPQNYIQLNNIVVLSVSLLYAVGENEGDPRNLDIGSWRSKALDDLNKCEKLLAGFCVGWPDVQRFREAFGQLAMSVKGRLIRSSQPTSLPSWSFHVPDVPAQPASTPVNGGDGEHGIMGATDWTEVTDFGTIDVEAFLSSVGLSDWTSGA